MKLRCLLAFFLVLLISSASAQEKTSWISDYDTAVAVAREQNRSLLLLFTGDWIPLCQHFDKRIMETSQFRDVVSEDFVLVRLNFPKDNRLPPETAAQYQLLKDAYRIRGYPAIVLTDVEGRPFGLNGFQPADPADYASQIVEMGAYGKQLEASREAAEGLEGVEMAKALIQGIPELPGNMSARYFSSQMQSVIKADPEDSLGKTEAYKGLLADVDYSKSMQLLAKDSKWDEMIELTDDYIEGQGLTGPVLQKALLNKSSVQLQMGSERGRIETLLRVVDLDADSGYGQEAQRQLDELTKEEPSARSQEP